MSYHQSQTLNPNYANAFGVWTVTTEGDCEGNSTRILGSYQGYLDEIALGLADKAYYGLRFTTSESLSKNPTKSQVNVSFDIDSGTWNMSTQQRVDAYKKILKGRPVSIEDGQYYACVNIVAANEEDVKKQILRDQALSKLTPEEARALLG